MLKKTLVIGASGYIGGKLFKHFRQTFPDTIGTAFSTTTSDFTYFSLADSQFSDLAIKVEEYQAVVICAAITNIAFVNDNPAQSYHSNVDKMLALIEDINRLGLHVIYLSSDNVYAGEQGQYQDSHEPKPISTYGKQKLAVEKGIQQICEQYTILRLSKIVGIEQGDKTLFDDINQQLISKKEILAADDLVFNPTYIADVVRVIDLIQGKKLLGTFNFCNPEIWDRYQITKKLAESLQLTDANIKKVKFASFDPVRPRPLNTTMINSLCFKNFKFTSVEHCLSLYMNSLKNR